MLGRLGIRFVLLLLIILCVITLHRAFDTRSTTFAIASASSCIHSNPGTIGVDTINIYRNIHSKNLLNQDIVLDLLACSHALWLDRNQVATHVGKSGLNPTDRCNAVGYVCKAENIALQPITVTLGQVVWQWMDSESHRQNILGPYTAVGIASYKGVTVAIFR